MGEISAAIAEAIRNRSASTTLITYSFFWLAWHWQGIVTLLFTSEGLILEKHHLLKNEYLNRYFFGWHGWQTFWGIVVPLILTVIFIWPLQQFALIHAYKLEQKSKTDRKKIRLIYKREIEEYEANLLKETSKKVSAEAEKVKAETRLSKTKKLAAQTDPTIVWSEDYFRFSQSRFFNWFSNIIKAVYEYSGSYDLDPFDDGINFKVSTDLLAFADTEGLVEIDQKAKKIKLTSKGKYFVKMYQQEEL